MGYVLLLGAPSLATKRRFKNVVLDLSEEFFLVLACKILLLILVLSLLFVLAMIVMGIASYFPDAGPLT
jgi:hypothetical protein